MNEFQSKPSMLLVGAASPLARRIAQYFATTYCITGIDSTPHAGGNEHLAQFFQVGYTGRRVAEIFRQAHFKVMLHVGRISSSTRLSWDHRFEQNVFGTHNLLNLGLHHGIQCFVVVGTHLVYGAARENHFYLDESAALRASQRFPELSDAAELDHETSTFIWQHPQVKTVLFRPVHLVGAGSRGAIATLLRGRFCPTLVGFDPPMQFLHDLDLIAALAAAIDKGIRGVYNVAGEGLAPLSAAIHLAGAQALPVPTTLAHGLARLLPIAGLSIPHHLVDFIKYPTIVSDEALRQATGWRPSMTMVEALRALNS